VTRKNNEMQTGGHLMAAQAYNMLMITVDCLRADRIPGKNTKNINELIDKGVLFTQAISNGSWTSSSFASIFTSTYPMMHHVTTYLTENDKFYRRVHRLREDIPTFIEILKRSGYSTCGFHSNPYLSPHYNYGKGFDCYVDLAQSKKLSNQLPALPGINEWIRLIVNNLNFLEKFYWLRAWLRVNLNWSNLRPYSPAESVTRESCSLLRGKKDKFFLWLHYMDLHSPYFSLISRLQKSGINSKALLTDVIKINYKNVFNPKSISKEELKELVSLYDNSIKYVDYYVGLLMSEMDEMGLGLDNTFVILTADHGELLGEHGRISHGGSLYDELLRVPLIICGPGIDPKTRIDSQVSLLDLAPTILDLLGFETPKSFLGKTLVPLIRGRKTNLEKPVVSEDIRRSIQYSCRTEQWKYIIKVNGTETEEELFDLKNDPGESENIIMKGKSVPRNLKSCLLNHISMESKFLRRLNVRKTIRNKVLKLKKLKKL